MAHYTTKAGIWSQVIRKNHAYGRLEIQPLAVVYGLRACTLRPQGMLLAFRLRPGSHKPRGGPVNLTVEAWHIQDHLWRHLDALTSFVACSSHQFLMLHSRMPWLIPLSPQSPRTTPLVARPLL